MGLVLIYKYVRFKSDIRAIKTILKGACMPTIIHMVGEKDQEEWERLHDMYQYIFLHGECFSFALALHRGLDWPLIALMKDEKILHAAVRNPDGRIHDVRGFVSEEEFGKPFLGARKDFIIREIDTSALDAVEPTHEHTIQCARNAAEILWPKLPWKETRISKIAAFADEFEALCRKHKLWIRAPFLDPTIAPPLAFGEGDEGGYELFPTIDGFSYTINRYLAKKG